MNYFNKLFLMNWLYKCQNYAGIKVNNFTKLAKKIINSICHFSPFPNNPSSKKTMFNIFYFIFFLASLFFFKSN